MDRGFFCCLSDPERFFDIKRRRQDYLGDWSLQPGRINRAQLQIQEQGEAGDTRGIMTCVRAR